MIISIRVMSRKQKLQKIIAYFALIGLIVGLIILISLPKDYFDIGESSCLSVQLFGLECYGCGMTRAVQHLIHLDFEKAYSYNWLAFVVLPLGIFMVIFDALKKIKQNED